MKLAGLYVSLALAAGAYATPLQATDKVGANIQTRAGKPAVEFSQWRSSIAGPTTKVATLGSIHLSQLGPNYDAAALAGVIEKLAAFRPDIITHEGLSGEQCDLVKRYEKIYRSVFEYYCSAVSQAYTEGEKATGLNLAEARAEAEALVRTLPSSPSPSQRRKLASILMAAGDPNSALVQWLQLPTQERKVGDGLNAKLVELIEARRTTINETTLIGAVLAARLGHQRIYAVDDHTADSILATAGSGYEAAIQEHWKSGAAAQAQNPAIARYGELAAGMSSSEGTLALFRHLQDPGTQKALTELDFQAALKLNAPELYGRQYVAWYEVRNLRMVANIRAAFANRPGARVLNLVGASHKAHYDAYFNLMADVEIVDTVELLK